MLLRPCVGSRQLRAGLVQKFADHVTQLEAAQAWCPVFAVVETKIFLLVDCFCGASEDFAVTVLNHQFAGKIVIVDIDRTVDLDPHSEGQQCAGNVRRV